MTDAPCTVWWAAPVAPADRPALVGLLDDHERARLDRFRRAADAARYLAAHALTRVVLAELTGATPAALGFDRTCRCGEPHGKPTTPGGPAFSLTHAGDLVGVAVWPEGPIGLDVELVRELPDLPALTRHVGSPAELARDELGGGATTALAFFVTWTRKEALLKLTGTGLAGTMTAITLDGPSVLEWTGRGAPEEPVWLRDLRPAPGYAAALAGLGRAPAVVEARGDDRLRAVG